MVLLLGTAAVIAILVTWLFIPGKPLPVPFDSPDALSHMLEHVRRKGLEGGELRIQAKNNDRMAVVVIKRIVASNSIELRGTVSDEAMLYGGYGAVKAALAERGIGYDEGDLNGRRTLMLRVRGSLAELEVFVERAMDLGFGKKSLSSDCVAYFRNVLLRNMPSVTGVSDRR
jgi:hypothetical protein